MHTRDNHEPGDLKVRLSMVIPVYNEEAMIGKCMERLAAQQRPIDECIVVDNLCTDSTIKIVNSFADRLPIKVVVESSPGVAFARATGFNTATGDIVGRIDADTQLEPQWTRRLVHYLENNPHISAVSGINYSYGGPMDRILERPVKRAAASAMRNRGESIHESNLFGNNMAIRRQSWHSAKHYLVNAPGMHEDLDLSYALRKSGGKIIMLPTLVGAISTRRLQEPVRANIKYLVANVRSARHHGDTKSAVLHALQLPLDITFTTVMTAIVSPYDPETRKWNPFRNRSRQRVSPVNGSR